VVKEFPEEPLPEYRKQVLELILNSLHTLEKREGEYRRERKEIAKSREKLYKDATRTSQELDALTR
jgi:hypothetical protein